MELFRTEAKLSFLPSHMSDFLFNLMQPLVPHVGVSAAYGGRFRTFIRQVKLTCGSMESNY
jgi:hypothetical protein